MTASIEDNARKIKTQMRYLGPGDYVTRRFVSQGVEVSTGDYVDYEVDIRDGREIRDNFKFDTHGFMLSNHTSSVKDFNDSDEVNRIYEAEMAKEIKALTGADKVVTSGWMIRTSADLTEKIKKVENYEHKGGVQPPAGEVHVDYSPQTGPRSAEAAYKRAFPDGPGYSRFIATSIWRTFSPPPQDVPLAVCDGRTVAEAEGVRNPLVIVDEMPEGDALTAPIPGEEDLIAASIFRYNPDHRWWYFSNMTRDEVLFFKFFDSDHDTTWRCPHTAFFDNSLPNPVTRSSIELRSIAFFEK